MLTQPHSTNKTMKAFHGQTAAATEAETVNYARGICSADRLAAELYAIRKANSCGIPQTVFRNAQADEWQHTNPFAAVLVGSDTFITILPSKYFQ